MIRAGELNASPFWFSAPNTGGNSKPPPKPMDVPKVPLETSPLPIQPILISPVPVTHEVVKKSPISQGRTATSPVLSMRSNHGCLPQQPSVYEMAALTQDLDTQLITTKIKEALLANNIGQKVFSVPAAWTRDAFSWEVNWSFLSRSLGKWCLACRKVPWASFYRNRNPGTCCPSKGGSPLSECNSGSRIPSTLRDSSISRMSGGKPTSGSGVSPRAEPTWTPMPLGRRAHRMPPMIPRTNPTVPGVGIPFHRAKNNG